MSLGVRSLSLGKRTIRPEPRFMTAENSSQIVDPWYLFKSIAVLLFSFKHSHMMHQMKC